MISSDETIALVTGASRGLGRAVAEALGQPGTHVIAVARTLGGLEDAADAIAARGGASTLTPLDLGEEDAPAQMAQAIAGRWGGIDLWVHCVVEAPPLAPAAHIAPRDLAKALAVNVQLLQALIAALEPLLRARPGATAIFPDDEGAHGKNFGAYGASKAAARALILSWMEECQRLGPRVLLAPVRPMPTAVRARFFPGEDRTPLSAPEAEARQLLSLLKPPH
ncbi:MAG: SDR family oxidoreductase [Pseudomonadota bacterium]